MMRNLAKSKYCRNDGFDEEYTALDGVTYKLQPEDIVITNQGKPIGIAGVM